MNKTYKLELTEEELSKLTCFCLIFKKDLLTTASTYEQLATEVENWDEKQIEKFKSNAEWHKETYEIITNILKKFDELPF